MEARRDEEGDAGALKLIRRGWCLGGAEFKRQMLEMMEGKLGGNHSGELRRETAEGKAERIIAEELGRQGWKEADLVNRLKNDPGKLAIAARVRRETTLTVKWLAGRLCLGSAKSANGMLHALNHQNQ